uniref:sushi, von Willebrand factor type A, EGF and pentraxin domain-containing protein 1-like isoform X1 n=1 Tax=Styela clava TaxID=7725 RepID=UPI00193AD72F|nr:sushi, von Willebrand factor type A, EGF and pentraxin domain-containing protein 1-like isoform X1 [Styela clava]
MQRNVFLVLVVFWFCSFSMIEARGKRDRDPLRSGPICRRPSVAKARVEPYHDRYYQHVTVVFICRPPFTLVGPNSATCKRNGNFTKLPECVVCKNENPPENGSVKPGGKHIEVGQQVRFACNHGYTLKEDVRQICEENGKLEGPEPLCERNPFCVRPPSSTVIMTPEKQEYEIGEKIKYKCKPHQVLEPRNLTFDICQENRDFTHRVPTCVNSTEPIKCRRPESLNRRIVIRPRRDGFSVGTVVRFTCSSNNFNFSGDKMATCKDDGTFDIKNEPTCKAKPRARKPAMRRFFSSKLYPIFHVPR